MPKPKLKLQPPFDLALSAVQPSHLTQAVEPLRLYHGLRTRATRAESWFLRIMSSPRDRSNQVYLDDATKLRWYCDFLNAQADSLEQAVRLDPQHLSAHTSKARRTLQSEPWKWWIEGIKWRPPAMHGFLAHWFDAACLRLHELGSGARQGSLAWRIRQELLEASSADWYCLFATLTWAPECLDMSEKPEVWKNYRQQVCRSVVKQMFGSQRLPPGFRMSDVCRFVCVQEHGEQNGRHHLHVVWCLAALPDEWTDPALKDRAYREIDWLRGTWPHGLCQHVPIRFGHSDAWSKIGWFWPLDKKPTPCYEGTKEQLGLLPQPASDPGSVAAYLSKYVCKPPLKDDPNPGQRFRTRCTQGLGLRTLKRFCLTLSPTDLLLLLAWTRAPRNGHWLDLPLPKKQIGLTATKELVRRMTTGLCPKTLSTLWDSLKEQLATSAPPLLKLYLRTFRSSRLHYRRNSGPSIPHALLEPVVYELVSALNSSVSLGLSQPGSPVPF